MSIFSKKSPVAAASDSVLVMSSLGGDRDAFCEIVSRYQNLLCSLAYSAVGDIKHSEDIAQEAFVEAWKKLDTLLAPEKLKAWLCGILRFKVSRYRRKEQVQATKDAQDIDETEFDSLAQEPMEDTAIREQEHTLLWQALDKIDDIYREPLILFYREQHSVEQVAVELDLSADTVKQRLSRGRKLLQKSMLKYVEDALVKSKPGIGFTAAVLLAINSISPPVKAAALGAGAVKTGSLFKLASVLTVLASFSGLVSSYFGLRSALDQSRTQKERKQVIKFVSLFFVFVIIFVAAMLVLKHMAVSGAANLDSYFYSLTAQLLVLLFIVSYLILVVRLFKDQRRLRMQERLFQPEAFLRQADQKNAKQSEYKSRLSVFSIPLVHFQFGKPEMGDKPAVGWIAGGSTAYGLVFAWGGVAVAPISVGIISVGVFTVGAVGFGLFAIGTVGIGLIALGASAIGYKAYATFSALGWDSAFSNGFSMAKEAAIGPIAHATHINNQQAAAIANLADINTYYLWVLAAIAFLVIVPAILHARKVRQRMK